jgi:hypothetical protein
MTPLANAVSPMSADTAKRSGDSGGSEHLKQRDPQDNEEDNDAENQRTGENAEFEKQLAGPTLYTPLHIWMLLMGVGFSITVLGQEISAKFRKGTGEMSWNAWIFAGGVIGWTINGVYSFLKELYDDSGDHDGSRRNCRCLANNRDFENVSKSRESNKSINKSSNRSSYSINDDSISSLIPLSLLARLETDYDISCFGFLPAKPPLQFCEKIRVLETFVSEMPIGSRTRAEIDGLRISMGVMIWTKILHKTLKNVKNIKKGDFQVPPNSQLYSHESLSHFFSNFTKEELRRAYVLFAHLTHSYVFSVKVRFYELVQLYTKLNKSRLAMEQGYERHPFATEAREDAMMDALRKGIVEKGGYDEEEGKRIADAWITDMYSEEANAPIVKPRVDSKAKEGLSKEDQESRKEPDSGSDSENDDDPFPFPTVPIHLAAPFYFLTKNLLGIKPVLTHSSADLWNWKGKSSESCDDNLNRAKPNAQTALIDGKTAIAETIGSASDVWGDRVSLITTFADWEDEEWFHLAVTRISFLLGPLCVRAYAMVVERGGFWDNTSGVEREVTSEVLGKSERINSNSSGLTSPSAVCSFLVDLQNALAECTATIKRVPERCRPEMFYGLYRHWLNGWLPGIEFEGLEYQMETNRETNDETNTNPNWLSNVSGGSAGQAGVIQVIDAVLGIRHKTDFLIEMRKYVCRGHREFLDFMDEELLGREGDEKRDEKQDVDTKKGTSHLRGGRNLRDYFGLQQVDVEAEAMEEKTGTAENNAKNIHKQTSGNSRNYSEDAALYFACVREMVRFRKSHWGLVQTHILGQKEKEETWMKHLKEKIRENVEKKKKSLSQKEEKAKQEAGGKELADSTAAGATKGTGGTELETFLKEIVGETQANMK